MYLQCHHNSDWKINYCNINKISKNLKIFGHVEIPESEGIIIHTKQSDHLPRCYLVSIKVQLLELNFKVNLIISHPSIKIALPITNLDLSLDEWLYPLQRGLLIIIISFWWILEKSFKVQVRTRFELELNPKFSSIEVQFRVQTIPWTEP